MREKMAIGQVRGHDIYKLPLQELRDLAPHLSWANPPIILPGSSPIDVCQIVGEWYVACSDDSRRREAGQFFTSSIVARYMANAAGALHNEMRVLDPGAGVGMLSCVICESALIQQLSSFTIVAYESDPILHTLC